MPSTRRRFLLSAALATGLAGCTGGESPESGDTTVEMTRVETTATTPSTSRTTEETTPETTATEELSVEPRRETPDSEAVRWRVALDAPVSQPIAVGDDAVYVAVGKVNHDPSEEVESAGAFVALDAADGTPRWTRPLPAAPIDAPRFHDGGAYCVSGRSNGYWGIDNRFHRFDPDGTERWRTDATGGFLDVLAFGDGRAYLGTYDDAIGLDGQRLFAVGLESGRTEWSVETGDAYDGRFLDGTLLVDPGGGRVTANHDARTGERRWRREIQPLGSEGAPYTVAGGALFVGGPPNADDERFAAVELADGTERWRYAEGGGESFVPTGAAVAGDAVVGTEYGGRAFALSVADGAERWTFDAGGETRRPPVVAHGSVYLRGHRRNDPDVIHALDPETGAERWTATVPGVLPGLHPAGETLAVSRGKGSGSIRALDPDDGTERWSFETPENLTRPAVADGRVYVVSETGVVRALGEQQQSGE